ncbi:MAG: hypothetical protein ABSA75_15255 [Candidatus Bathyarchaeia archaeon]
MVKVEQSLIRVEKNWKKIDDELDLRKIGRKDTPFNADIRAKMMNAYELLDNLLRNGIEPFSKESLEEICELNNLVHYGLDSRLRQEYVKAIVANSKKYYKNIDPIINWYENHMKKEPHPLKVAAEVYVAILGHPQLFIEGNHRTGSIISSWINMYYGYPPFVLSLKNAIPYFGPSADIKKFANKSTWRGRSRLPKYRKSFKDFWEKYIDWNYVIKKC